MSQTTVIVVTEEWKEDDNEQVCHLLSIPSACFFYKKLVHNKVVLGSSSS